MKADEKFSFQANFKFNNFHIWLMDYLHNKFSCINT